MRNRLKSRTHWYGLALSVLGIVEANFHLLQASLGDNYGYAFIGVAAGVHVLRELTTKPVADK